MLPHDPVMLLSYAKPNCGTATPVWTRCVTVRRLTVTRCVRPCARSAMKYDACTESLCVTPVCVKFERGS